MFGSRAGKRQRREKKELTCVPEPRSPFVLLFHSSPSISLRIHPLATLRTRPSRHSRQAPCYHHAYPPQIVGRRAAPQALAPWPPAPLPRPRPRWQPPPCDQLPPRLQSAGMPLLALVHLYYPRRSTSPAPFTAPPPTSPAPPLPLHHRRTQKMCPPPSCATSPSSPTSTPERRR